MATYTRQQIIDIITAAAQSLGVPVDLALAIANQESGLDPNVLGDGGHSVGLFQLNDQGEGHGMSVAARQDPATNARIALTQVANVLRSSPNLSPGQIAAAAQRPKDRVGYAKAIDAALGNKLSPEQYADMSPEGVAYRNNALSGGTNGPGTDATSYSSIDGFLKSQAPALAAELSDPEVQSLLQRWGTGDLSDQQFQNQLEQTAWWKNTPQSQRQLLVSQATDPATVKQNLDNQAASVWALANQMGVALNAGQVSAIAEASITGQWSSQQVKENIASHFQTAGQDIGGEAATDAQALKALYAQYALPPGDPVSLQRQVQQLLSTGQSVNSFAQQLAQQAKSLYGGNPDLAAALDRGETVSQFMQPYANVASQRLGVDPNEIDWTQPKWNAALTGTTDPGSGRTTPMSLMQWQRTIMTDPTYGWAQSQDGISQATHGAQVIAQGLGLNVA